MTPVRRPLPAWADIVLMPLINIALAVAALVLAALIKPGPEMALAEEIRNMAAQSMETEMRATPMMGALGGGLDRSAMAGLVLPALTAIIGGLARRRREKGQEKA